MMTWAMELAPRVGLTGALALALTAMSGGACTPNHVGEGGPMAADTARGIVEVVGAEPITRIRLRTADGPVMLSGDVADELRMADGTEVRVTGSAGDEGMRVESWVVRAVDGVPAVDGVLELDGGAVVVVTGAGERVRFAPAPAGLRELEGRRVWVAAGPDGEPRSWGSLARDR